MPMYANKVNGFTVAPAEAVTSQFEYIAISSTVPLLPNGVVSAGFTGTPDSQAALDKLVEIVSLRGQPVIMGAPAYDGTANFTIRFAVEHALTWSASTPSLAASIQAHAVNLTTTTAGTTTATPLTTIAGGNTTVTFSATL